MSKSQKTPGPKLPAKRNDRSTWKPREPLAGELFKARIHNQTIPEDG